MTMLPTLELALKEAAARRDARFHKRRPTRRVAVAIVACSLALTGTAVAAISNLLPFGDSAPDQTPLSSTPLGQLAPGTDAILAAQAADPEGGPIWGLRVYRTTAGVTCLQPGRIQAGVMGVVGDDGKFHPQNPQVHDCQQGSSPEGLSGRAVMLSSGQSPAGICRVADEVTASPSCGPAQIRTVTYGVRATPDGRPGLPYINVAPGAQGTTVTEP